MSFRYKIVCNETGKTLGVSNRWLEAVAILGRANGHIIDRY